MKGKKFLSLIMCAAMMAGMTVTAAAEENGDSEREVVNFFRADDGHMDVMEAVIDAFEASQDKYAVNIVVAPNDSNQEKSQLTTSFSAGSSEYDVVSIDTAWAGDLAGAGYLEALDTYMKDAGRRASDYNKGSLDSGTYRAKTYALPINPDYGVLFFRKDIVSEEDAQKLVSGEYNYEDLIAMAENYKGQGGTKTGLVFQANQYEGLVCNANEWTSNFTDIKGGLELMKKAVDSEATPEDILVYQEDQTANSLINGDCVFARNWPYAWALMTDETAVHQDQVEIAPLPTGSCIGGWLAAINANSEHKDGAWAFLDFLTSMDGQVIYAAGSGCAPGWTAAAEDAQVKEGNKLLENPGFVAALNNTIARPSSDNYQELSDNLQILMHKYLSGEADIDSTVTELESLLEAQE
ncbi:MAG: extracellular solute-binding protein [Blautia sp.]|nr:extracellular solute-binding protein [Blautia sp.]